ncbi:MAG: hypothetical protein GWN93_07730 [Deltaproteobacteria bacterium]|nr:hypothetical protein [Deltaproteobacteria bacterium]
MPERKTIRKYPTPDVQGDDSWVVLRSMTVGEVLDLQRDVARRLSRWGRIVQSVKGLFRGKDDNADKYQRFVERVISYIADWNWVDQHGNPLPNPQEHPEVVTRLTDTEMASLATIIYGNNKSEDEKN